MHVLVDLAGCCGKRQFGCFDASSVCVCVCVCVCVRACTHMYGYVHVCVCLAAVVRGSLDALV